MLDNAVERPAMPPELRPGPRRREMETHLLGVEVAIAVAVGDGNDVEVLVGAALRGGQPLQGPVQLALAGALRLEKRGHETAHQKGDREEKDTVLGVRSGRKALTESQDLQARQGSVR